MLTEVHIVKALVFPVVMYGCESWTIKKAEQWKIIAFELWCWRRLLRSLGLQRDQISHSSQRKLTLNIHWKNCCWSLSSNTLATWCGEPTHCKRGWCWERLKGKNKKATENEMVREHCWLSGHEFEQTPGDNGGQKKLACYSPWGCRVRHNLVTEQQT